MPTELTLNGAALRIEADARRTLLEILREDLGLTGTKYGCGEGDCRACTVLVDGRARASCQLRLEDVRGRSVVTIEGLAGEEGLHPVQRAFIDAGAMQCGYCVPGMVLATVAILADRPRPTEEDLVRGLNGHICRCCGYESILRAARRAAGIEAGPGKESR